MYRPDLSRFSTLLIFGLLLSISVFASSSKNKKEPLTPRAYWINTMLKIADPVLTTLSQEQLRSKMPVESIEGQELKRKQVTYLEALGRLVAGIAPWLELGPDSTEEGKLRAKYIDLTVKAITNAVNPSSPDFMNFTKNEQPLVDAAFLAQGLLRAPNQLYNNLDSITKVNLVNAMISTRAIKPYYNNWLLFSAMIEAFLLKTGHQWDAMRIDYAIKQHLIWYKGDSYYGDGADFHWDYYNSFVIQPMMLDILSALKEKDKGAVQTYELIKKRAIRHAEIQERLISPEGTFPPIGRSLAYRFGAFQVLSQISLMNALTEEIRPSQVRSALTAVIKRTIEMPNTFDAKGWLTIGFSGHQPSIGEHYISTGSLYLCSVVFLPLGLDAGNEFWSGAEMPWTSKKAWMGEDFIIDYAE